MTEIEDMAALADELKAFLDRSTMNGGADKFLRKVELALRSASRTGPGFAERKKQISRIVYGIYGLGRGDFGGGHQNASIQKAVEAIAAIPAPARESVTVEEIKEIVRRELTDEQSCYELGTKTTPDVLLAGCGAVGYGCPTSLETAADGFAWFVATALLSTFTITRKSKNEERS